MRKRSSESGHLSIVLALSMIILCGFAGLAADVGTFFRAKRIVQTAVDSAAIAGAAEIVFLDVATAAQTDAARNGVSNCSNFTGLASIPAPVSPATCSIVVNNPPLTGPHTCANDATYCQKYVEVLAKQNQRTFFMGLFGWNQIPVAARAVAYPGSGANQGCIYALQPTGTNISLNDAASGLAMPNCAMYSNSSDLGAIDAKNSKISAKYVGIVGGYKGDVEQENGKAPFTGLSAVKDPLLYLQSSVPTPTGTCKTPGSSPAPGFYCKLDDATLSPGLYILSGNLTGNVTCPLCIVGGKGVTIYFTNGAGISLKGNTTVTLNAESCSTTICSDGAFNGIAFWSNDTGQGIDLRGNSSLNATGVLYYPHGSVKFWGSSGGASNVAIVAQTISIGGSVTINGIPVSGGISPVQVATLAE